MLIVAQRGTPLVPGTRYVLGYNMDSGTISNRGEGSFMQTIVNNANIAQINAGGPSGRYSINNQPPNTISGGGELSRDGATWEPDLQMTFRRVT